MLFLRRYDFINKPPMKREKTTRSKGVRGFLRRVCMCECEAGVCACVCVCMIRRAGPACGSRAPALSPLGGMPSFIFSGLTGEAGQQPPAVSRLRCARPCLALFSRQPSREGAEGGSGRVSERKPFAKQGVPGASLITPLPSRGSSPLSPPMTRGDN